MASKKIHAHVARALSQSAQDWKTGHGLFEFKDKLPKTAALLAELAAQIDAGTISKDEANDQAITSLENECNEVGLDIAEVEGTISEEGMEALGA